MSQPAYQARSNLSRTLTYRAHIRASYYALLGLAGVSVLLVIGLSIVAYINGSNAMAGAVAGFGILAPLILFIEANYFVKPLAFVKIKVHQFGLSLESPESVTEIAFQDVAEIKFSHLPYIGGWFKLKMKSGASHRFTVVLERSEYILEMLASARPDVVQVEDIMNYRRTAVLADHSWARVTDKVKNYKSWLIKYLGAPAVLTALWIAGTIFYGKQGFPDFGTIVTTVMVMLAMNLAVGFLFTFALGEFLVVSHGREKLLADASSLQRDYAFEKTIDRWGQVAHWVLAIGICAFALVRFQF
jgi:hypothetical protein